MMTKKTQTKLQPGQRFLYTEGRKVKLLLEVSKKPKPDPYTPSCFNLPIKILHVIRDVYTDFELGPSEFSTSTGTWTYLEGQDRPKRSRK